MSLDAAREEAEQGGGRIAVAVMALGISQDISWRASAGPLAVRPQVTPADLDGEPLIAPPQTSLSCQRLDHAFARACLACRPVIEAQNAALVATLIVRGLGIELLDPFTALGSDGLVLAYVPLRLVISQNGRLYGDLV